MDVSWFSQQSPGDVVSVVAPHPGADLLLVTTDGRRPYARRRTASGWTWTALDTPPGAPSIGAGATVPVDAAGTIAALVISDVDGRVWCSPRSAAGEWVDLGTPAPDAQLLTAATVVRGGVLRPLVLLAADSGRPWLHDGIDPDGTWFPLAPESDWELAELAITQAAIPPAVDPQPHLVAVVRNRDTFAASMRVGFREGSVWTWIDPGPRPDGATPAGLSATTVREADALLACAVVAVDPGASGGADTVAMMIGSGRNWRWEDLGKPPTPREIGAAVVAAAGPVPADAVVVARAGHDLWLRSRGGDWTGLGTTPGDAAVVNPRRAFDLGGGQVRILGTSWTEQLWTAEIAGATATWLAHGSANAVAGIAGAYTDPQEPDVLGLLAHVFVVDDEGRLWGSTQGDPFNPSWDDHGLPATGATAATAVGVTTAVDRGTGAQRSWVHVIGSDGHLHARSGTATDWSWVDHGAPPGRRVTAALPPPAVQAGHDARVHTLADDGQLWLRADGAWDDRGTPPGQLIFALVGAGTLGGRGVTATVGGDGHLWVETAGGTDPHWVDLGVPVDGERVAAGIGAIEVSDTGNVGLQIVVASAPSGRVWGRTWTAAGTARPWVDLGAPQGVRIRAALGLLANPAVPAGGLAFILADDGHAYVHDTVSGGGWDRWGDPGRAGPVTAGRAVLILDQRPAVVGLGADHRLWIATRNP